MCTHCVRRSGVDRDTVLASILCTVCWSAITADTATPSGGEDVAAAIRGLPRTARHWTHALRDSSWFQGLRSDVQRRLRALLTELARRADWTDHLTRPTWARLQETTGWSRASIAAWIATLKKLGWLVLVERGTTHRYRNLLERQITAQTSTHADRRAQTGNRAAVYQLRLPDHAITELNTAAARDVARPLTETVDIPSATPSGAPLEPPSGSLHGESWTPTGFTLTEGKSSPHTRARTIIHNKPPAGLRPSARTPRTPRSVRPVRPSPPRQGRREGDWFDERVPLTRGEMLAAARQLRDDPLLARLSPRAIRAAVKAFWRAGWTNNDLRHALAHQPTLNGPSRPVERCPASQVRWPSGWLRHRLAPWTGPRGPLTSPHLDARQRATLAARHGRAAAQRLPYGHTQLPPTALRVDDQQPALARTTLACNQARDRHALLTGLVPDHDTAGAATRESARAQITALLQARRSRRVSSAGASC
ncbi:hypothetical protein [Pseudonocardia sp. ICBG1293]|uniref:hypothetical protein n=2 Tax=Pseudonocardia sp. ICBG1293 TaxID=2844382 RepID=UPI001CCC8205|nr:hypothetical protein [Pseudonocardia sp. ICBG1293]